MDKQTHASGNLAATITKTASKQTYYTIRLFADRKRAADAYRAYGYFRWMDDIIDIQTGSLLEKIAFANRQKALLESGYRRETLENLCAEEWMLVDLVHSDTEKNSGLQTYLRNMMDIMVFDAGRRTRIISQSELTEYSHKLAKAVTEALFYFIGHDQPTPFHEARYLAVTAAHITHMLRDALDDTENGYFNIPSEILKESRIRPQDVTSLEYRKWVCGQVKLARRYFKAGREYTAGVRNLRCRLVGYAYMARFEWILNAIEQDNYYLRPDYPQRKSLWSGMWMGLSTILSLTASFLIKDGIHHLAAEPVRIHKNEN